MNAIVKGSLVVGALLILGAGVSAGLRGGGSDTPETSPSSGAAEHQVLTIAAASDLKFALDEWVREFRAKNPGTEVRVTYGSSGNFSAQLANGAPFDLFLSADVSYPRTLASSTPWAASWCGCPGTRRWPWSSSG
jgi:molybdate transport system substrate-binding protein